LSWGAPERAREESGLITNPSLAAALLPAKTNMNKVFYTCYAAALYVCPSSGNKLPNK
jgi:hypothetical protein